MSDEAPQQIQVSLEPKIRPLDVMSTNAPHGSTAYSREGAPGWRHPLVVLITGCLFVMGAAVIGLGLALYSATTSRNNLQSELACRGRFSAETQQALGTAVKALADSQVAVSTSGATTLSGLDSLATNDGKLPSILSSVPDIVKNLTNTGTALQSAATLLLAAADAQEASLAACKQ